MPNTDASEDFDAAMARFAPALPLAVAYSGGADSSALLLACARRWPGQVSAVHVHHGLQEAADAFAAHCADTCARLGVPLRLARVDGRHRPGESPEDAARRARYAQIRAVVAEDSSPAAIKTIVLGQHADDQVETLLIALLRGAGLAGLAGMAARWEDANGLVWERPLLRVPGAAIRQWLRAQGETWVEDPSNADQRYTRNRLRALVLPALEAASPAFRHTVGRSARHAAEAMELLREVAEADFAAVGHPPVIKRLQALSPARQANVLRHWLRREHATTPSTAQLTQLQRQIAACTTRGHGLHLLVGAGEVRRDGERLVWRRRS